MLKNITAFIVLAIAISGCSTGSSVSQEQMAAFTDKQSTKKEVINVLGQPQSRVIASGENEKWTYGYTFIGVPFTDLPSKSKTAVFEFDKSDVLVKHYVRWYPE